jgi:hypothetical protein
MESAMVRRRLLLPIIAVVLVSPAAGQTEKSVANAGTLTCTAGPPAPQSTDAARLSCKFQPLTGPEATFVGTVRQPGNAEVGEGKIVLIWTVLAPQTEVSAKALEGTYVGSLGGSANSQEAESGLVGGADKSIHLRPLAAPDQAGANPSVSVLELKLSGVPA